jgi:hypothetical protein
VATSPTTHLEGSTVTEHPKPNIGDLEDRIARAIKPAAEPGTSPRMAAAGTGTSAAHALLVLRQAFGKKPPLYAPLTENAIAAGTAALIELRSRLRPLGERDQDRPAKDIAREVLTAAAPFVQRDMISRLGADRLWLYGWFMLGPVLAAAAGLTTALVYALVTGVTWLAIVSGVVLVLQSAGVMQMSGALARQRSRTQAVLDRPLTGPAPADDAEKTVDISTAAADKTVDLAAAAASSAETIDLARAASK